MDKREEILKEQYFSDQEIENKVGILKAMEKYAEYYYNEKLQALQASQDKGMLSDVGLRGGQLVCRLHSMRKNCSEYRYSKKYCKTCQHNIKK